VNASGPVIDCKLTGSHGTPELVEAVIERCDLSPAGDGTQIGTRADMLRLRASLRNRWQRIASWSTT